MLHSPVGDALVLCDDATLGSMVDDVVVRRDTVAAWPLSWTQKVTLSSGRAFAYKAMLPPLIESDFYAAATSALLPGHRHVGTFDGCDNILIEWIDSPSLADAGIGESDMLTRAIAVVKEIGGMPQDLPVYLDVGTPEKWSSEVTATVHRLRQLNSDGWFSRSIAGVVDNVESWALSGQVLDEVAATSRLVHRDLKPAHVFPVDDGYRVIDWQVPAIAPGNVDLVLLLEAAGIDSFPHVDRNTYGIASFLNLRWAVVAQHDFFPGFTGPLFRRWTRDALRALGRMKRES